MNSLFNTWCASECPLWDLCGGPLAAPCFCIVKEPDKRYKCHECDRICVERNVVGENGILTDDIFVHIQDGKTLNELELDQIQIPTLPLFIPTRTHEINDRRNLPYKWVGVDAKYLLSQHKKSKTEPRSYLSNPDSLRNFLHVDSECNLLAVLNARDDILERFWGMPRRRFLTTLDNCGFSAVTGPTFSVIYESNGFLPSHNILMLMRHHQVISEIAETPMVAIPNIYWRNFMNQTEWSEWLNFQSSVSVVSRDFSLTKQTVDFLEALEGLIVILMNVDRPLHIVCIGVGIKHAGITVQRLAEIGCTVSVVSSDPILSAIKGGARLVNNGELPPSKEKDFKVRRDILARINIDVMTRHLESIAKNITLYNNYRFQKSIHSPKSTKYSLTPLL